MLDDGRTVQPVMLVSSDRRVRYPGKVGTDGPTSKLPLVNGAACRGSETASTPNAHVTPASADDGKIIVRPPRRGGSSVRRSGHVPGLQHLQPSLLRGYLARATGVPFFAVGWCED